MTEQQRRKPAVGAAAKRQQEEQRERLAEALRRNLKMRKEQARARAGDEPGSRES